MQDATLPTWFADVQAAFAAGDLVDPPDWVRERARALFHTRSRDQSPVPVARIRATLVLDSRRRRQVPAGVRSIVGLDGPWQLLYRGDDVDVDLLVRPNQDGHTMNVRGQATSMDGDAVGAGEVEARPAEQPSEPDATNQSSARSEVEPSGEFALTNLEHGRYDVWLRFGAREIELSDVEF